MPPARSPSLLVVPRLLAVAFGAAAPLACSLDWTVRSDPGDAASSADAALDRAGDVPSSDGGNDAPLDAGGDAPDCASLQAKVIAARKKARECNIGTAGQCTTSVQDECRCPVPVTFAAPADATQKYLDAIDAYETSCTPDCSAQCRQLTPQGSWACLSQNDGVHCVP